MAGQHLRLFVTTDLIHTCLVPELSNTNVQFPNSLCARFATWMDDGLQGWDGGVTTIISTLDESAGCGWL